MAVILLLSGCGQPNGEQLLKDYQQRLARISDLELDDLKPSASAAASLYAYPRSRYLRLAVPEHKLSLLDFLRLLPCPLQSQIGEKNSPMGKLAPPSLQLLQEYELIRALDQCIALLKQRSATDNAEPEEPHALLRRLQQLRQAKQADWATIFWNGTWGSDLFQQAFKAQGMSLNAEQNANLSAELAPALEFFIQAQQHPAHLLNRQLALAHMQTLEQSAYLGRLLHSAVRLQQQLVQSTQLLEQRLAKGPVCFKGRSNTKAEIFFNVFHKYYVGRVQPYMANISQELDSLLPLLAELAESQIAAGQTSGQLSPSAPFLRFYQSYLHMGATAGLYQRLKLASRQHAQAWQVLFKQCGAEPQASR